MLKVLPIAGYSGYKAFQAFHKLLLGLKMLPMYSNESYNSFYRRFDAMPDDDKLEIIKEMAILIDLENEEVQALLPFCCDKNGIPYNKTNINNLSVNDIIDIIVSVCFELSKIKIDILTEKEKKKLTDFSVDLRNTIIKNPNIPIADAINMAFYKTLYPDNLLWQL